MSVHATARWVHLTGHDNHKPRIKDCRGLHFVLVVSDDVPSRRWYEGMRRAEHPRFSHVMTN